MIGKIGSVTGEVPLPMNFGEFVIISYQHIGMVTQPVELHKTLIHQPNGITIKKRR